MRIFAALTSSQVWLLVCSFLVILFALAFLIFLLIRDVSRKKYYRESYAKTIYQLAMDNDYFLINDFSFRTDANSEVTIDHILFGNRYIFCLKDVRYQGVIQGHENDQIWFFYPNGSRKRKEQIQNPLIDNRKRVEKLSLLIGADKTFFISIVLFNNDCYIEDVKTTSRCEYIRNVKEFKRLIAAVEKRPIQNIEPRALEKAVLDIARLKEQYNKNKK